MYTLYYSPGSASMAPHVALQEIGAPHEAVRIDIAKGDHKRADYLAINPDGRVPTLRDGDRLLTESAAILMHLADKHPAAGLAPTLGSFERGRYYQWLLYLSNTLQATYVQFYHPDWSVSSPAAQAETKASAERQLDAMWLKIDAALAPGPYLLGAQFSAADIFLTMLVRWCRRMAKPAITYPNVRRCAELVRARPAFQRVLHKEGLEPPVGDWTKP